MSNQKDPLSSISPPPEKESKKKEKEKSTLWRFMTLGSSDGKKKKKEKKDEEKRAATLPSKFPSLVKQMDKKAVAEYKKMMIDKYEQQQKEAATALAQRTKAAAARRLTISVSEFRRKGLYFVDEPNPRYRSVTRKKLVDITDDYLTTFCEKESKELRQTRTNSFSHMSLADIHQRRRSFSFPTPISSTLQKAILKRAKFATKTFEDEDTENSLSLSDEENTSVTALKSYIVLHTQDRTPKKLSEAKKMWLSTPEVGIIEDDEPAVASTPKDTLSPITSPMSRLLPLATFHATSSNGSTASISSTYSSSALSSLLDDSGGSVFLPRIVASGWASEQFDEVSGRVYAFLTFNEICACSQVCRKWRESSKKTDLWLPLIRFQIDKMKVLENVDEKNIWEDNSLIQDLQDTKEETEPAKAAARLSLNQLVARLTPSTILVDQMDLTAFLGTFKTFTTTQKLVRKLIERYFVPIQHDLSITELSQYIHKVVRPIQLRVCNLLKMVIEGHFSDFNSDTWRILRIFIRYLMTDASTLSRALINTFMKTYKTQNRKSTSYGIKLSQNPSVSFGSFLSPKDDNIDLSQVNKIADQLTAVEFAFLIQIKESDFAHLDSKKKEKTTIDYMVDHFNAVSRWVQLQVLKDERPKHRARRMEFLIQIAMRLREMNNFETMMAITSSLNDIALFRLSATRAEVKHKYMKALEEMQTLMSSEKSYANYRAALQNAPLPAIPYLGVHLRDLIYYEDYNSADSINFKKKKHAFETVQDILRYQTAPFAIQQDTALSTYFVSLPSVDDHENYKKTVLYELSLKREPRLASGSK